MTDTAFDARDFLRNLTESPGVYRMLDAAGEVIYVGKARNLKNRVSSYFRKSGQTIKTRAMVAQIADIQVTATHTETEALLLEDSLIKRHRPRYNILLRDDKSYPYIFASTEQQYPRLAFHRGARREKGRYFGPYPSSGAVRETLNLLQKIFRVRQCEDSFFRNRSRPCLQYQIDRCTGPCVGLVDPERYRRDVEHTIAFLEGRSQEVIGHLVEEMEAASADLEFEQAAVYRDQIAQLRAVGERQYVAGEGGSVDVVAAAAEAGTACVQVFFIRDGRNLGNRNYFLQIPSDEGTAEVLEAFLSQYYLGREIPGEIIVSERLDGREAIEGALAAKAGRTVKIRDAVRGDRARWLGMAKDNARQALAARLASRGGMLARVQALQEALGLDEPPARIECFDISHTRGEATVASCVVFDGEGPRKSDYRRFNIRGIEPGDDYAAMHQALERRFTRLKRGEGRIPDVLLIDGGKGQVAQAEAVIGELQVPGVMIVGVAKGPARKPGQEKLVLSATGAEIMLDPNSPALHLIQQVRDEAHRFAITGHRQRRGKARRSSTLEGIPGVGAKRRQQLLKHFGGLQQLRRAGVEDLTSVPGISRRLAQTIYDHFH